MVSKALIAGIVVAVVILLICCGVALWLYSKKSTTSTVTTATPTTVTTVTPTATVAPASTTAAIPYSTVANTTVTSTTTTSNGIILTVVGSPTSYGGTRKLNTFTATTPGTYDLMNVINQVSVVLVDGYVARFSTYDKTGSMTLVGPAQTPTGFKPTAAWASVVLTTK